MASLQLLILDPLEQVQWTNVSCDLAGFRAERVFSDMAIGTGYDIQNHAFAPAVSQRILNVN